jgi:hypothetical protein
VGNSDAVVRDGAAVPLLTVADAAAAAGGAAEESSRTRAARASALAPRSQSAMSSDKVWRSRPVSRIWDIWKASSSDSFACLAATGSVSITGRSVASGRCWRPGSSVPCGRLAGKCSRNRRGGENPDPIPQISWPVSTGFFNRGVIVKETVRWFEQGTYMSAAFLFV